MSRIRSSALALAFALGVVVPAAATETTASETPGLPPELVEDGADLVGAAERYLAEGQLGPAVEVADEAVRREPRSSRAHLLAVQALAAVRVHHPGEICRWEAWQDRILAHLQVAWALDGSVLERVQSEPELEDVRVALADTLALRLWPTRGRAWRPTGPPRAVNRVGFPVMMLEGLVKKKHAKTLVVHQSWHGWDAEREHDGTRLDLMADGTARWARVVRDADGSKHAEYKSGTWTLDKMGLHLVMEGEPQDMAVTLAGLQVGSGEDAMIRWTDQPYDCTRPFDVWKDWPQP